MRGSNLTLRFASMCFLKLCLWNEIWTQNSNTTKLENFLGKKLKTSMFNMSGHIEDHIM
jgi:hypothetical protein